MNEIILDLANGEIPDSDMSAFEGFIGQESVIKKIKFFVDSNNCETPFPTLLFTGSHGLGKTFVAKKISQSLGRHFISVNCGSLKKKEDFLRDVIYQIHGPTTIFMDEAHEISSEIATMLLTLLNPTEEHVNQLDCGQVSLMYDMRLINVVFATTDAHKIFTPLRNRCFSIYFSTYGEKDLIKIINHYLNDIEIKCNVTEITEACRSRARDAFVLSQNIKRYVSFSDTKAIGPKEWKDIKDTFEIYPRGLNREELRLLKVIKNSGPISCSNLALRLMVNEDNVKSELEVRLRELGMIENTTKGRQITSEGLGYFNEIGETS